MRARLSLRVRYDAPALQCRRVLRILPLPSLAIESQNLSISPLPTSHDEHLDRFGNRVLQLRHARIESEFSLALDIQAPANTTLPPLQRSGLADWKLPSRAVTFPPEFIPIAREFRALPLTKRAEKLNTYVFDSLQYISQTTPRPLNATDIWTQKRGTCADFAHVLLALGRMSGLPARYVAGFGPAPGALHAWVEFGIEGHWHGFDPTHGRRAEGLYLPVATGRDFYDCAPHQGSFRGGSAHLTLHCELK
ncbi:transglutaminase family protein [bacterium]|nr:MAG: transglutaminase family protein [bacterium]